MIEMLTGEGPMRAASRTNGFSLAGRARRVVEDVERVVTAGSALLFLSHGHLRSGPRPDVVSRERSCRSDPFGLSLLDNDAQHRRRRRIRSPENVDALRNGALDECFLPSLKLIER